MPRRPKSVNGKQDEAGRKAFGQLLKETRESHDITQEELAYEIGYEGPTMISRVESGAVSPSGVMLLRWLSYLGIDLENALDTYTAAAYKEGSK